MGNSANYDGTVIRFGIGFCRFESGYTLQAERSEIRTQVFIADKPKAQS